MTIFIGITFTPTINKNISPAIHTGYRCYSDRNSMLQCIYETFFTHVTTKLLFFYNISIIVQWNLN